MSPSMGVESPEKHDDASQEALLSQIEYLALEAEALQQVISIVPDEVLTGRPMDDEATVKEMYGMLISLDEGVYGPSLEDSTDGYPDNSAATPNTDVEWNVLGISEILDRLARARRRLVSAIRRRNSESWRRRSSFRGTDVDLYELTHAIIQTDVDVLRAIGERLHSARLTATRRRIPR